MYGFGKALSAKDAEDDPEDGVAGENDKQPNGCPDKDIFSFCDPFGIPPGYHPQKSAVHKHQKGDRPGEAEHCLDDIRDKVVDVL